MSFIPVEQDTRYKIDNQLKNLKWIFEGGERQVYFENPRSEKEKKLLNGKHPDYVLYSKDRNIESPLIVIEAKRVGKDLDSALTQGEEYAEKLKAPIVFAIDGNYCKSLHLKNKKPLIKNGEELDELIRESLALLYLEKNEVDTRPKEVRISQEELIYIFAEANDMLRKEGFRAGIERFNEFANILFLKLLDEIEELKGAESKIEKTWRWSYFKTLHGGALLEHVNEIVLPKLGTYYNDADILPNALQIKSPKVLREIIEKLDPLVLTDINSDVKGDAFEYFLKKSTTTRNDLGEYFTPRHIVKMMVSLVNPEFNEKIYDPFCGTGGMLIETYKHILRSMPQTPQNIEKLQKKSIYGNELTNTARITKMSMILAGDGHSNIRMKDSLSPENLKEVENKFDVVISNIPYSQKTEHGGYYDLPSDNGDSICIQHCLKAAKVGGRMAIVVPEGFLFKKELEGVRKYLFSKCHLHTIISLPRGVFLPYTGVKTDVLYCTKIKETSERQEKVWFFKIENDGFSLNNKREKLGSRDDIDKFLSFKNVFTEDKLKFGFQTCDLEKIKSNNFDLRYNQYAYRDYSSLYELIELSEILTFFKGKKPSILYKDNSKDKLPYFTIDYFEGKNIEYAEPSTKLTIANKGDILIVGDGQRSGLSFKAKEKGIVSSTFYLIKNGNEEKIRMAYLFHFIHRSYDLLNENKYGSGVPHLDKKLFLKLKIPILPISIQKEIEKKDVLLEDFSNKMKNIENELTALIEKSTN